MGFFQMEKRPQKLGWFHEELIPCIALIDFYHSEIGKFDNTE